MTTLASGIVQTRLGDTTSNAVLFIARVLFGFPLMMNGVGQIVMPGLMESQMDMVGVSLVWKWPAILASLLGGLAILTGWQVRLASFLLIIYVVTATVLFHNTHMLADGAEPLAVPQLATEHCTWFLEDFKGISDPDPDLIRGCAMYRLFFDMAKFMDHITMMVPALLLLIVTGGGRWSVEGWLARRRKD